MSGLFGTLNIGKSGMFAQQGAINTTSHNIANAKTEGYSRQRVELQTTRPYCKPDLNSSAGPGQVGTGVEIVAINRVRDSFLDYQIRVELGVRGQFTSRDKFLSQIENILNEPTDVGISTLFDNFFKAWHDLVPNPQSMSTRAVVVEQSSALANELNHTYSELTKLKETTQMEINNTVVEVNTILNQIDQLNQEIVQVKIAKQQPNDLMDKRDLLLDQLSEKFGIEIKKENFEGIVLTTSNNSKDYKKKISAFGGEPPYVSYNPKTKEVVNTNLVQIVYPEEVARFSYIKEIKLKDSAENKGKKLGDTGDYEVTYYVNGDKKLDEKTITVNVASAKEFKRLDHSRVLWTDKNGDIIKVPNNNSGNEIDNVANGVVANGGNCKFTNLKLFEPPSGQFKGQISVQEDIEGYQDRLNNLAKALAFSVNAIHTQNNGKVNEAKDGDLFFVNGKKYMENGGVITEDEITAQNIMINQIIKEDPMKIIAGVTKDSGEGDGNRALAMEQLKYVTMDIQSIKNTTDRKKFLDAHLKENDEYKFNGKKLFTIIKNVNGMTMQSAFNTLTGNLGVDTQEAKRMIKTQKEMVSGFEQSRKSISGVSLDEEFANLVQFNHCYQANAKIISTVDQLLDVVINGLKR